MKSYKLLRRSFLQAIGAAAGLQAMLRNAEAQDAGAVSPSRFLVVHHPVGTIRTGWLCTGSGTNFTFSEILKPFETAMLKGDMVILDGINMDSIPGIAVGHEFGTVAMATGAPIKWTRTGQTETDDAMAAGPSIDQLLLSKSPKLQGTAFKSLQALCDDRIDHQEISCRCITYDLVQRPQPGIAGPGVTGASYENTPIRPTLRPLELYTRVFGTVMPGGPTDALAKARAAKRSVLDFSLRELTRIRTLAPASQKPVLDAHEAAIRDLEKELDGQGTVTAAGCGIAMPPPDVGAVPDDGRDHPETTIVTVADDTLHQQIGEYHQAIIRAAFKCDLTRTATFQWSPGTNHIAFKGLHPDNLNGIYTHHPVSHNSDVGANIDAAPAMRNGDVQYLVNVEKWYNTRMSEFLNTLKSTVDVFGNPLLDNTLIPYVTEVSRATHQHNPMPLIIFGGKSLGLKGGQFLTFAGRPYADFLLTLAQAFGVTVADLAGQPLLISPHNGVLAGVLG
jgi:hypothetical protein